MKPTASNLILVCCLVISCSFIQAQSIIGKWKNFDQRTGKERSVVEIFESNGKVYGKVIKVFRDTGQDQDPICSKCTDDRKDKKIVGMQIIRGMKKDGTEYEDGTICDPEYGMVFDCKIWLEKGKLKVRGYWGLVYQTQTWVAYKD